MLAKIPFSLNLIQVIPSKLLFLLNKKCPVNPKRSCSLIVKISLFFSSLGRIKTCISLKIPLWIKTHQELPILKLQSLCLFWTRKSLLNFLEIRWLDILIKKDKCIDLQSCYDRFHLIGSIGIQSKLFFSILKPFYSKFLVYIKELHFFSSFIFFLYFLFIIIHQYKILINKKYFFQWTAFYLER